MMRITDSRYDAHIMSMGGNGAPMKCQCPNNIKNTTNGNPIENNKCFIYKACLKVRKMGAYCYAPDYPSSASSGPDQNY